LRFAKGWGTLIVLVLLLVLVLEIDNAETQRDGKVALRADSSAVRMPRLFVLNQELRKSGICCQLRWRSAIVGRRRLLSSAGDAFAELSSISTTIDDNRRQSRLANVDGGDGVARWEWS